MNRARLLGCLVAGTAVVVAASMYLQVAAWQRPPSVQIQVPIRDVSVRTLLVETVSPLARQTETRRTDVTGLRPLPTYALAELQECQFYLVRLRYQKRGVQATVMREVFGKRSEVWEGPDHGIVAIDPASNTGWVLCPGNWELGNLGAFFASHRVQLRDEADARELCQLLQDFYILSRKRSVFRQVAARQWEFFITNTDQVSDVLVVRTDQDGVILSMHRVYRPKTQAPQDAGDSMK